MSHRFYEGEIFHRRFLPKDHRFTYDYFFLDIDVYQLHTLQNSLFSQKGLNAMEFFARDHFGNSDDFFQNSHALIASLGWNVPDKLRYITLPRMFHFVFNPITLLLLLDANGTATHAVAQVHNYNGGRVLYPMKLDAMGENYYRGTHPKTMYVSPFMGYDGEYRFDIRYTEDHFDLEVELYHNDAKLLLASFSGLAKAFLPKTIRSLLCSHTFLTFFVVTRTLWQTLFLKFKGLEWNSPRPIDHTKKEIV